MRSESGKLSDSGKLSEEQFPKDIRDLNIPRIQCMGAGKLLVAVSINAAESSN